MSPAPSSGAPSAHSKRASGCASRWFGATQKFDVVVAKNYLTEAELAQLSRLVNAYLDVAEDIALRRLPMTMQDWEVRLNRFLAATDREVLQDAGRVTAEIARAHAESEFEKYRIVQDRLFQSTSTGS